MTISTWLTFRQCQQIVDNKFVLLIVIIIIFIVVVVVVVAAAVVCPIAIDIAS